MEESREGLAPVFVGAVGKAMNELRRRGYTILLVEQNFHFSAALSDRLLFMESGRIIETLNPDQLDDNADRVARMLSV